MPRPKPLSIPKKEDEKAVSPSLFDPSPSLSPLSSKPTQRFAAVRSAWEEKGSPPKEEARTLSVDLSFQVSDRWLVFPNEHALHPKTSLLASSSSFPKTLFLDRTIGKGTYGSVCETDCPTVVAKLFSCYNNENKEEIMRGFRCTMTEILFSHHVASMAHRDGISRAESPFSCPIAAWNPHLSEKKQELLFSQNHPIPVGVLFLERAVFSLYDVCRETTLFKDYMSQNRASAGKQTREDLLLSIPLSGPKILALLSRYNVVHNDIKPENILFFPGKEGRLVPRVIDFGIMSLCQDVHFDVDFSSFRNYAFYSVDVDKEREDLKCGNEVLDMWMVGTTSLLALCATQPQGYKSFFSLLQQLHDSDVRYQFGSFLGHCRSTKLLGKPLHNSILQLRTQIEHLGRFCRSQTDPSWTEAFQRAIQCFGSLLHRSEQYELVPVRSFPNGAAFNPTFRCSTAHKCFSCQQVRRISAQRQVRHKTDSRDSKKGAPPPSKGVLLQTPLRDIVNIEERGRLFSDPPVSLFPLSLSPRPLEWSGVLSTIHDRFVSLQQMSPPSSPSPPTSSTSSPPLPLSMVGDLLVLCNGLTSLELPRIADLTTEVCWRKWELFLITTTPLSQLQQFHQTLWKATRSKKSEKEKQEKKEKKKRKKA
mmetsp:Transcript_43316/g.112614  ORF Transcript_43316/g.112614 Transcript_43316/m.112614 type:complete len:647 (-) Transcript_43316:671-2611(-)